jgi:hypothetical protein
MKYSSLFIFIVIIGIAIIVMTSMKIFTKEKTKGSAAKATKKPKKESMTNGIIENMETSKQYLSYNDMYHDRYDGPVSPGMTPGITTTPPTTNMYNTGYDEEEDTYTTPTPTPTLTLTPTLTPIPTASTCDIFSNTNAELSKYFQTSFIGMMEPIMQRVMDDITNSVSSAKTCNSTLSPTEYPYVIKCPGCDISNGVCINCGGKGGRGTSEDDSLGGVTNNLIDTTGDVASGIIQGTGNAVSSVVKGVTDLGDTALNDATLLGVGGELLGSQIVDTAGNLALDAGDGIYNLANNEDEGDEENGGTGINNYNQSGQQGTGGIPFGSLLTAQNNVYTTQEGDEGAGTVQQQQQQQGITTPPTNGGIDNYSAYGALIPKGSNFVPLVASFSAFAK